MSFVVHRVAKSAARYTDAGGREKCGLCRFFVAPRSCGKVIGPVSPMGWCKYFSRQMVSQFGGSIFTGGPSLSLDFMTPGSLDPRITFTRASTATYTDASGTIQTAAVNAPRWDYDPVTHALRGLLIEEARTNLLIWTGDLNNAVWAKFANIAAAPVTLANQAIAPNGTLTAASITYPAVSGGGAYSAQYQGITGTAVPYTASIWLRGSVGGEQTYIEITDNATYYVSPRLTLTTQWQRFSVTSPALTVTAWYLIIGTDLRGSQTSTPAQTIYAWGAQVEQGAFPTSYIPTTAAAVTRAADVATIPFTPAASGTYQAEFVPNGVAASLPVIISGNAGSPVMSLGADSRLVASIKGGASVFSAIAPAMTFGAVNKTAFGYLTGGSKAAVNGATLGANAVALTVTGTSIEFGSDGVTPGNNALNGTLRRVTYWPRVLSDAEMQQVTT